MKTAPKEQQYKDLTDPILTFVEDVRLAQDELVMTNTPYHRRVYVRTVFTLIEGTVYQLKRTILFVMEKSIQTKLIPGMKFKSLL